MRSILCAILSLILAVLESLGSTDGAAPSPPGPPEQSRPRDAGATAASRDTVPFAPGREYAAAVFALFRVIDPCGLHDVAAAQRITGDHGDEILPVESLSVCRLRLRDRPLHPTWTFTTRVGIAYPAAERHAAEPEEIGGRRFFRAETPNPRRSCVYTRPVGGAFGISLTVDPPADEPNARPCQIAKAYLMATPALTRLVLRAEQRTEPRLPLASLDPCAATRDVLRRVGVAGTADPQTPYECRIQPDGSQTGAPPSPPVTIRYGFTTDPGALANASARHQPVTVAGRAGVALRNSSSGHTCELVVGFDDRVAIQIDRTRWVQTVSVHTTSCDHAQMVADIVLNKIVTR